MKHLFTPYPLAILAKEKGFDEPCLAYWEVHKHDQCIVYWKKPWDDKRITNSFLDSINAPIYQQIVDWFREKHGIYISVGIDQYINKMLVDYTINKEDTGEKFGFMHIKRESGIEDYYQAIDKAIEEAFKLI